MSTALAFDTLPSAAKRPMKTDGWENSTVTPSRFCEFLPIPHSHCIRDTALSPLPRLPL